MTHDEYERRNDVTPKGGDVIPKGKDVARGFRDAIPRDRGPAPAGEHSATARQASTPWCGRTAPRVQSRPSCRAHPASPETDCGMDLAFYYFVWRGQLVIHEGRIVKLKEKLPCSTFQVRRQRCRSC